MYFLYANPMTITCCKHELTCHLLPFLDTPLNFDPHLDLLSGQGVQWITMSLGFVAVRINSSISFLHDQINWRCCSIYHFHSEVCFFDLPLVFFDWFHLRLVLVLSVSDWLHEEAFISQTMVLLVHLLIIGSTWWDCLSLITIKLFCLIWIVLRTGWNALSWW